MHPVLAAIRSFFLMLSFVWAIPLQAQYSWTPPEHLDGTNPVEAEIGRLSNLAGERYENGEPAEALPLALRAMQLADQHLGSTRALTLRVRGNYAHILSLTGRNEEAEPILTKALSTARQKLGEYDLDTEILTNQYANLLLSQGRYQDAEPLFADALRLARDMQGDTGLHTSSAMRAYADVLLVLNRMDEALELYREALRLNRQLPDFAKVGVKPDLLEMNLASSLAGYARGLAENGQPSDAEPLMAEALAIYREKNGNRHPNTLATTAEYALLMVDLGRNQRAEALYAELIPLYMEVWGPEHPRTLIQHANYAGFLVGVSADEQSLSLIASILDQKREILGTRHPSTLLSIRTYARALFDAGKIDKALPLSRELVEVNRASASVLGGGSALLSSQLENDRESWRSAERFNLNVLWTKFGNSAELSGPLHHEAFLGLQHASAGSTSRAVIEAAASRFASSEGAGRLVRQREALVRRWTTLEKSLMEARTGGDGIFEQRDKLRLEIDSILGRVNQVEANLAAEVPQYFAILGQQAIDLDSLRTVLGEDEAILFLEPTTQGTHSMGVSRSAISWARSDKIDTEIADTVGLFRLGLEIQAGDSVLPLFNFELAHSLYVDLIAPIEEVLEDKKRVYVIAGGALSRIPIGTLISEPIGDGADYEDQETLRSAKWLINKYSLVKIPSLQSLVYVRSFKVDPGDKGGSRFLGFGDPVLGGEGRVRGARSATLDAVDANTMLSAKRMDSGLPLMDPAALKKLTALPGTRRELQLVKDALNGSGKSLFLAENMTEPTIREIDLSNVKILHLATHGFTSEESGLTAEPGLVFTPPEVPSEGNDGYLSASEIVSLDLKRAQWVILSACNTASPSGKPGETGLSGLAQAFLYSGAESLLVSHWPVFDDIAPILTVLTVRGFQDGMPRAEAFRRAVQHVRDDPSFDAAHPGVWAPFALVGEGR